MSNVEEEKGIVTQDVGDCGCGQNVQGRRPQYMPQFAPQQGGRRQYGQMYGGRPQQNAGFHRGPQYDARMAVRQSVSPSEKCSKDAERCFDDHAHKVNGKKLLAMIDRASFAMDDTRLFLDTHPDSKEAFAYFKKMEKIRNEAIKEYEIHCGPMLSYHSNATENGVWNWNEGPLPWNNDCCNGRRV